MSKEAWLKFLEGDENSFSEVYHAYFNELFAYALKIGFDEETCKDAIHDVFFKIYVSKSQLYHIQNIEFYLLHCLKNRLFDIYKSENKITEINFHDIITENESSIIERMIKEEREIQIKKQLIHLLKSLPPKQRKIIQYHYQLNLSSKEIGELLDLSPAAVKKSIYRALKKMKEKSSLFSRQDSSI